MTISPLNIDIVLPVRNEAKTLYASVIELHTMLTATMDPLTWQITIADNASTDDTGDIAQSLAAALPHLRVIRMAAKGRGRALKNAWLSSTAQVVAYMDIDLSTDLKALAPLVAPLLNGHSDLAIGSRLAPGSRVVRGTKREFLSRGYNLLLHTALGVTFSDAQCGFKAMTSQAARLLLPVVEDNEWFFDTELLVLAERSGLRIAEVAVDWLDDPDSTVDVPNTIRADLAGIGRLGWQLAHRNPALTDINAEVGRRPLQAAPALSAQVMRFALIGIASTAFYSLLFLVFHSFMSAQWSNFSALAISAVLNTMVNRRLTFGVRDPATAGVHLLQGLLVFSATWALTSGVLALGTASADLDPWSTLVLLTFANGVATILRFAVLRVIFRPSSKENTQVETHITRRELMNS